jgi:hypothetical protein
MTTASISRLPPTAKIVVVKPPTFTRILTAPKPGK